MKEVGKIDNKVKNTRLILATQSGHVHAPVNKIWTMTFTIADIINLVNKIARELSWTKLVPGYNAKSQAHHGPKTIPLDLTQEHIKITTKTNQNSNRKVKKNYKNQKKQPTQYLSKSL